MSPQHTAATMDVSEKEANVELQEDAELDPQKLKKLVRKIDLWLMPAIWIIYLLSFVDRSNIGLAKVAGMEAELNISPDEYYLTIALFQVGYVVAEIPSNMILSVTRPSLYIPTLMVLWGGVAAALGAVKNTKQLIGLRVLLGIFEAGFSPAVLFLISTWYLPGEQSKRFITFLSAGIMSGAFGSIVSGAITSGMDGAHGIPGWRWLFIIEGVATVGAALVAPFFLLDYPSTSKRLTEEERYMAFERLKRTGQTSPDHQQTRAGHMKAFTGAILSWRVWLLSIAYMSIVGSLSLSYFYPTLIKGLGYSSTSAQFMTAPLFVVALVIAIPTCILADRMSTRKGWFANRSFFLLIVLGTGALFCALAAGIHAYIPRYVFLCFINSMIWTANPLALSFASTCLRGVDPEQRAVSLAIINGSGNLAQLYGSALFPATDAPVYLKGFAVYAGCMFLGAMLYSCAYFAFQKWPFKKAPAIEE